MSASNETLRDIARFWHGFARSPLYETGFCDAVRGASNFDDEEEARLALSYLKGYADAARLACPYQGPSWRIAHSVGCAAGTFLVRLQLDTLDPVTVSRLVATYTAELTALCAEKRDEAHP